MTKRPEFLNKNHENGQTIVEAFRKLPEAEAVEVDAWFVWANAYGSMTWQERCLAAWIDESWEPTERVPFSMKRPLGFYIV